MKRDVWAVIATGGSALLPGVVLVAAAADQPPGSQPVTPEASRGSAEDLDARLNTLDARIGAVHALRATFVQQKHTPLLKKPMESSGTVRVKGERTRWDTVEPSPSTMTTDATELRIYFPEQRVVEVYDLAGDIRELSGSPLPKLAAIRASFDLKLLKASELGADDADRSLVAMELVPRVATFEEHITSIRVLLDERIPAVRRIEVVDIDGERTDISFHDIETNPTIEDHEVALEVPAGVRTVHPLSPGKDRAEDPRK